MVATHARTSQLNIKSPEARRLATDLAQRRGESVTQTVTTALRLLDERQGRESTLDERRAAIAAIQERVAEDFRRQGIRPPTKEELDEEMYDERGLPR